MANGQGVDYSQDMAAREGEEPTGTPGGLPGLAGIVQQPGSDSGPANLPGLPTAPGMNVDVVSAQFLKHWLDRTPQPGAPAPGSFGDKLRSAVGQFSAGLGDAAAATEQMPEGVGGIGGITRTLAARTKRLEGERKEAREAAEFRQRSAMNNLQMASHVSSIQKQSQEIQDSLLKSNKDAVKAREDAGWHVEHGVSEMEARKRINDYKDEYGRHYTDVYEFVPTGFETINGQKVPQYDVVEKTARMVKPSKEEAQFIKDNGGPDLVTKDKQGNDVVSEVSNVSLTSMRLAAQRRMDARTQIEDSLNRKMTADQLKATKEAMETKAVNDALGLDPADKVSALTKASKMYDDAIKAHTTLLQAAQKTGNQEAIQEAQHWLDEHKKEQDSIQTVLKYGITPDERKASQEMAREREKEQHDVEMEKIGQKRAEAEMKRAELQSNKNQQEMAAETDPEAEGLEGQDYLDFLKKKRPDDYNTVRQIGEGRAVMPARLSKDGRKIWNMTNRAYPDWNQTLGKEWPSTWQEYMGKGKTAQQVTSYNALFRHMAALYENTTGAAMIYGTDAYNKRQEIIGHVKEELGRSMSAGVMAESDKKELENRLLGGFLSPEMKRTRIQQAAQLVHDRMEEMQTKFDKAKPSAAIEIPALISDNGRTALDYVVSGGKTTKPEPYAPGQKETGISPAQKTATPAGAPPKPQAPDNAQSEITDKNGVFWGWKLKDGTFQKAPGAK